MSTQAEHWSRAAVDYEKEFVDPYLPGVRNPLLPALRRWANPERVVADLGCGIGPLLPFLADHFGTVHAVDFAPGMLQRARERVAARSNVAFHHRPLTDLTPLHGRVDVAVAVNSLVQPDIAELEAVLRQVRRCLKPDGVFLGIVPAIDGVHYYTMLLVDRALDAGKPIDAARKNAGHLGELHEFDFAFGQFAYKGLRQHFWQGFEIRHRLERTGFRLESRSKVRLSWRQFAAARELSHLPAPWDWFFQARITDQETHEEKKGGTQP